MSLGVLNNLSAVYAENYLNNTNNSLNTVLQQLSSGSRINSGADDAAGLSLANGLGANRTALTQSETNATEGVGLLQVADGALSQVTSLLNRAVTLATEASNGTLNSTQDAAANQEYQSILSEISNIGSTTTYNQETVFGGLFSIYTGDSSSEGSSIDDLNVSSLSSSNLGETNGVMAYSSSSTSGANGVFIDSGAAAPASTAVFDSGAVADTITLNYLTSSGTTATATIGTTAAETLAAVASAINGENLGLTATVTNAQAAGVTGSVGQNDEGLLITGSIGTGTVSAASYTGSLAMGSTGAATDDLTGSITLQAGTGTAQTVTMSQVAAFEGVAPTAVTVANLESYINSNAGLGVTATTGAHGALTLTSTAGSTAGLTVSSNLTDTTINSTDAYTATAAYSNKISLADAKGGAAALINGATSSSAAVATMSFTDTNGESLSGTNLSNSQDAQAALTDLNTAIADVSAQDGYIGAMINTLNAVSNVLATQGENIESAQNAVQATDYASATSNMSKFEILSQTGISALAQANSVQQEVLKLLQ